VIEPFLWGVATSAYQSEGGYNGPGEPVTNWARAEAKGDAAVAGATADFWHRYEEDFARCEALGLGAFRLGLEWSRIQPVIGDLTDAKHGEHDSHASPPLFDYTALDHYAKILASSQQHGLEPVVTLHHFVHPAWLGTDPWLDPRTPERFAAYVREAVSYLNPRLPRPLRWFITINEPNMLVLNSYFGHQFPARAKSGFATMMAAYNQLLRAHVLTYNMLHDVYRDHGWEAPRVSLNNYCSDVYWSDKLLLDLLCARERGVARHQVSTHIVDCADRFTLAFRQARLPLHKDFAYYIGALAKWVTDWVGRRQFQASDFAPVLDALYSSPRTRVLDYIGLDYYDPFAAHIFRLPAFSDFEFRTKSFRNWALTAVTSKWWDWRVLPRGLYFFCKYYAADFGRAVLIAENGMALRRRPDNSHSSRRDKHNRSNFLRLHVHEINRARHDGVPIAGYLHWSLFDNYEWGSFTPRFGLYSLDYTKGTERLVEDHTGDRPAETYAELIRAARKTAG
jgi:beta-glucosidase/6-phospho-beta-glucosidase/beta-galactosidase